MSEIYAGFLLNNSIPQPAYRCPGANCTWEPFDSLAICYTCTNITSHIQKLTDQNGTYKSSNITYTIGNNLRLINPPGFLGARGSYQLLNATSTDDPPETFAFKKSQTLLSATQVIHAGTSYTNRSTPWETSSMLAFECGLELCVNTYNSSVLNNNVEETIIASTSVRVPSSYQPLDSQPESFVDLGNPGSPFLGNTSWTPAAQGAWVLREDFSLYPPNNTATSKTTSKTFNITQPVLDALTANITMRIHSTGDLDSIVTFVDNITQGPDIARALYSTCSSTGSPDFTFSNLATAMTVALRNSAGFDISPPDINQV